MRKRVNNIHFVGVGGSGMSGIAEVLVNLNYNVSGSDINDSPVAERLRQAGVRVVIGHHIENIKGTDVVVVSTAIDKANPEVSGALEAGIPVIPRAEMLGELMRFQQGIAVAGTHGKTTTTSLVSAILIAGELDPTFVVGGLINGAGVNAKLGQGDYLVAEADESDASFLNLKPEMAIVTNIDEDHMVTYEGDLGTLKKTFVTFLQNLPFYGLAVLCEDDANVRSIRDQIHKPMLSYGLSKESDYRAYDLSQSGQIMHFKVARPNKDIDLDIELSIPGEHNVLNATAAIAIASHLGVSDSAIVKGLKEFQGVGRRFQVLGDIKLNDKIVTVVDDYAHHPVELNATLTAARGCWDDRRLVAVFQPHRYSRTYDLFDDFVTVLAEQQDLLLCDVYPAGEQPISGATGQALSQAIRVRGASNPVFVPEIDDLANVLAPLVQDGDVILTMGAGSIGKAIKQLFEQNSMMEGKLMPSVTPISASAREQFGKVAVLMGGVSSEREVSLLSGAQVLKGLQAKGVDAHGVDATPENIGELKVLGFDRVFIVLHGRWGEDGVVQGALQSIGLPYTGSGVLGCALSMDKVRTKQVWQSLGLPTAKYRVLRSQADLSGLIEELSLPLFLKPAREGSSVGVGKVTTESELLDAYKSAAQVGDDVLAEQFIAGAELSVTILKGEALPSVRMSTENEFYDYEAKYQSDDTQYFCPAGIEDQLEQNIGALALSAFEALDCSVWGRVDVMLDAQSRHYC